MKGTTMLFTNKDPRHLAFLKTIGRLKERERPDGSTVLQVEKDIGFQLKGYNQETNTVPVIATDARIDRMGDIININGWNTKYFRQFGSILVDHSYRVDSIIGRPLKVAIQGTEKERNMQVDVQFDPLEENEAARKAVSKLQSKSLRNVSVGFNPTEWEWRREKDADDVDRIVGIYFKKQELLELSFVAVPANPGAHVLDHALREYKLSDHDGDMERLLAEIAESLAIADLDFHTRLVAQQLKGVG